MEALKYRFLLLGLLLLVFISNTCEAQAPLNCNEPEIDLSLDLFKPGKKEGCEEPGNKELEKVTLGGTKLNALCEIENVRCQVKICSEANTITVAHSGGKEQLLFRLLDVKGNPLELQNPKENNCQVKDFKCESCEDNIEYFVSNKDQNNLIFKLPPVIVIPTLSPTSAPTASPTTSPAKQPTSHPTQEPTPLPIGKPSSAPTKKPTSSPFDFIINDDLDNDGSALATGGLVAGAMISLCLAIMALWVSRRRLHKKEARVQSIKLMDGANKSHEMVAPLSPKTQISVASHPSIGTQPFILRMNSAASKEDQRKNFLRFSMLSKPSTLSLVFRNEFSNRQTTSFERLSLATGITASTVRTFKRKMSADLDERSRRFKAVSARLSENYSRINELLGMSDGASTLPKPKWTQNAQTLVKKVAAHLEGQILTQEEVEQLENMNVASPLAGFSNGESVNIDLEFYLFRLVNGLNKWFSEDDDTDVIGMRSLLFGIIYLRKIKKSVPFFGLTVFNVHRVFAILLLVAAKFTEDELISNAYWADVCGLPMDEVNKLEESFCFSSEFDFFVTPSELDEMGVEFGLTFSRGSVHRDDISF